MSGSSLTFLLSFFTLLSVVAAADNNNTTGYNTFVYSGCSPQHYTSGSSYESYVDSILASISAAAAASSFANFTSPGAVSGLYQCRADLPASACASCVRSALSQLASLCPSAAGAAVQLRACFLRYGNDSFLGKPDTSLLFKKCGAAIGAGIGGGGDVDAALEAVMEGAGEYRVGGAGRVQAVAQCVGDLIAEECGECVKAAVEQLENYGYTLSDREAE
ncbi:Cysteine-rich repeat secretory protein 60 [Ananas comosus]|uniref:Cysteine-rich repeat secretory protein 60 n=1 Tax=Ananas comosus TaxID=4615 RepID=A0A199UNE3_ANACO|nr:Cysteine-rich repeat secretory protein 60 [Ananas comosus]